MGRSVSLAAYMLLSRFGERWFARKLNASNLERKGIASAPRPDGSLIWINALSVQSADAILTAHFPNYFGAADTQVRQEFPIVLSADEMMKPRS